MYSLLVIDDDKRSRESICEQLGEFGDTSDIKSTCGAKDALEMLKYNTPDVIVLGVVLSGMDGLEVLKRIRFEKRFDRTIIIMVSCIMLDHVASQAMLLGANGCLWKPINIMVLHEHICKHLAINECGHVAQSERLDEAVLLSRIKSKLDLAGIESDCRGYDFLCEAIEIVYSYERIYSARITEDVYKVIAERNSVTLSCVERSIRMAIKKSWDKNPKRMSRVITLNRKPSNADLMAKIASLIRYCP